MGKNHQVALTRKGSTALMRPTEPAESFVTPIADVYETSEAFIVKLDLPGAAKDSININVEENRLSVKCAVQLVREGTPKLLFGEIRSKTYYREFVLGEGIDHYKTGASFDTGVLTITLPKSESMKAREIPIK